LLSVSETADKEKKEKRTSPEEEEKRKKRKAPPGKVKSPESHPTPKHIFARSKTLVASSVGPLALVTQKESLTAVAPVNPSAFVQS
jgi:hypothetical protein